MNKNFAVMAMVAVGMNALAQQALWGVPQIKSPEINPDKTVTFRVMAPDAKDVKVTGDFLPTEKMHMQFGEVDVPGSAALVKGDDGMWTYTTPEATTFKMKHEARC